MSSDAVLSVESLWKSFYFYRHPSHRFLAALTRGRRGAPQVFHALRDVSFSVGAGRSTGIIGANGAGKSTLLKIITGTLEPTRGRVGVRGRIASLLELGTGFHPLFTGRQNIFYNARFLGLHDAEIHAKLPRIVEFAELGAFIDRPLRTYSSGMQMRLAFSVAANVDPEILILDEVLAVGDAYFVQKCLQRVREFRDRGTTILFVSHDLGAVKSLCDRAVLLHEGTLVDDGEPAPVIDHYNALIARKTADTELFMLERVERAKAGPRRSGNFDALISEIELLDARGGASRAILAGDEVTVRIRVFLFDALTDPTVGILIRDRLGNDVYGTNTYHQQIATGRWEAGASLEVRFRMQLDLGAGEYTLTAAVHRASTHVVESYDWLDGGLVFRVLPSDSRPSIGVAYLRPAIEVGPAPGALGGAVIEAGLGSLPTALIIGAQDGDLLRRGWHALEGTGDETFRWTEAECTFLLTIEGEALHLELAADRPADWPTVDLRLSSVDREIGVARVRSGSAWQVVTFPLPAGMPAGPAHLKLTVRDGWEPARTGHSQDARELGVRIRRVWCEGRTPAVPTSHVVSA